MLAAYPMKERTITRPSPSWKLVLEAIICGLGLCSILASILFIAWCVLVVLA